MVKVFTRGIVGSMQIKPSNISDLNRGCYFVFSAHIIDRSMAKLVDVVKSFKWAFICHQAKLIHSNHLVQLFKCVQASLKKKIGKMFLKLKDTSH